MMIEITQEDRSLFMRFRMLSTRDLAAIETGEWDCDPDLVAIARHRIAARERAIEECAKAAEALHKTDELGEFYRGKDIAFGIRHLTTFNGGR